MRVKKTRERKSLIKTIEEKTIIAKKDFLIVQNEDRFVIRKGDDIIKLGVPAKFFANLKTEKVIE